MRQAYFILFLIGVLGIYSCGKDIGKVTVTYQEATAIYGDIQDIRNTGIEGEIQEINNPGKIFVTKDFILLGEEEKGIHVIDNTSPANPIQIGFINIPGNREFIVVNNTIYAESYYDMVKVDISDLNQPILVKRTERVFGPELENESGLTLIGFTFNEVTKEINEDSEIYNEISQGNQLFLDYALNVIPQSALPSSFAGSGTGNFGAANRIALNNDHLFVISRNKLHVLAEESFELLANNNDLTLADEMETIFPYQDKLFIGTRTSMDIVDIKEASNPSFEYRFDHATSCDPVLPVDGAAYITLRTADFSPCPGNINALVVLDIGNLDAPRERDEISMISPYSMSLIGDRLFVGEGNNGLKIFDASNRLELEQISYNPNVEAFDIIAHPSKTDHILIAGPTGLSQYEIGEELNLTLKSHISF